MDRFLGFLKSKYDFIVGDYNVQYDFWFDIRLPVYGDGFNHVGSGNRGFRIIVNATAFWYC